MHYYVYRIICSHNGSSEKYYYGYRSCKIIPEKDNYWSSSKYVKEAILKYGLNYFKKKIIKKFNNREAAIKYEIILHEKFSVDTNKLFFNRSKQSIWGFNCTGSINKGKTYEQIVGKEKAIQLKLLRSNSAKGKNNSGVNNPMYGKKHTENVKKTHSKRMSGMNHPHYGFSWITNGIENKKINLKTDNIDDGWYKGRTSKLVPPSPKGKIWVNNGQKNRYLEKENNIPDGWVKGKLRSK